MGSVIKKRRKRMSKKNSYFDRAADTAEWGTCQNTAYTARLINRVVSLL